MQIFRLDFWGSVTQSLTESVKDRGMAVCQVKRFQQLQEQRTQAFHELGTKLIANNLYQNFVWLVTQINDVSTTRSTPQNLPLSCSKIWRRLWRVQEGSQVTYRKKYCSKMTSCLLSCSGVTERFQKISLEIIEIKKSLEEQDPPQTQSASMIARVQVDIYFAV